MSWEFPVVDRKSVKMVNNSGERRDGKDTIKPKKDNLSIYNAENTSC